MQYCLKMEKILALYCDKIRYNRKHMICYPKGTNKVVIVSMTPSDTNAYSMVFRDFRRIGVYIKELDH